MIMRGVLDDAYLPNGVRLRFPCGGAEVPLFMVHGHPHNYLIWHKVVPDLARDQMVIFPDMRETTAINPRVSRGVSRALSRSVAAELCFEVSNYFVQIVGQTLQCSLPNGFGNGVRAARDSPGNAGRGVTVAAKSDCAPYRFLPTFRSEC